MRVTRVLYCAVLIVVALVLQVSALSRLGLPGAVPDLLLVVVVGLAMVYGPTSGAVIGFAAGLCQDLAPPSDHAAGRYALVLCLAGYIAGHFDRRTNRRSVLLPVAVVVCAPARTPLAPALLGAVIGDATIGGADLGELVVTAVVYDAVLAPFVVPPVMAGARRVDPQPLLPM